MTVFLFWNINGQSLENLISGLVLERDVDVLMLAECLIAPDVMLSALNYSSVQYHYVPRIGCERIEIFTRFSDKLIQPVYETDQLTVRHLRLPGTIDILLAVTHFISKLYAADPDEQLVECIRLAEDIREAERQINHARTVLTGDLNMNPFESGMVLAHGLHAVMSQQVARRGQRTIQGIAYPFFYNPMWSFLGDLSPGPAGTYYYSKGRQKIFYWNMFDQVLIRPGLLDHFDREGLQIIESVGDISLLSERGTPDIGNGSDHLPLLFSLSL